MLTTVKTKNGLVRGLSGNNTRVSVFKGIPFAAPPVGENRWRAPMPCKDWDGILDAYKFAPISMQDTPGIGDDIYCKEWHVDPDIDMDEDCLYLNVWTNAKSENDKLPVLVWFFGGAFQWGYPPEMEFNGENIAKRGVIVVSVNYRLGAFGFLAHPDLSKEAPNASTNFGALDQQAGIKWVIDNISAFGGDPNNITIAGQSAGGGSVLNQLTMPSSKGLFQKAVLLSGIIRFAYHDDPVISPRSKEEAEKGGMDFFTFLGVSSIDEARKIDAKTLRDKASEFRNKEFFFFTPSIDGVIIPDDPFKLFMEGKHAHVPILAGNTDSEFAERDYIIAENENDYLNQVKEIFGNKADEFLSFPEAHQSKGNLYAFGTSLESSVKSVLRKNDKPSYYYRFEVDIPGYDNPGTFHSVDLWFFFETLAACWRPFKGRHFDIARNICNYYTNFIKTGNPNGKDNDDTPMSNWGAYNTEDKNEIRFTKDGCIPSKDKSAYVTFISNWIESKALKKEKEVTFDPKLILTNPSSDKVQAFNPYLPSWEYIPDGEPYVFNDRVYIYGSHDIFNGHAFCLDDYVCWSAPINNLGSWRYEGITYKRTQDPINERNNMCLYAPDVTVGPDGKYYMYYVLDKTNVVSVAVCDTPAGKYEFYGYVHYEDGIRLGEKDGDEPQFDPAVLTEGNTTYLYTGFCGQADPTRTGAMVTVLGEDMLTIKKSPKFIAPSTLNSKGTEFEKHAFFEGPSIRFRNGKYYFIYSSEVMHELCYAISDSPEGEFKYGGVIVSNTDIGIDSYKAANTPAAYGANNHGSMVQIGDDWYIFYHRHTNNTWYSRQGCAEKLTFTEDGHIKQAELTSCGLNNGPLRDTEEYPAYIVCNIIDESDEMYLGNSEVARVTQEGKDVDKDCSYVANIRNKTTLGYKYFNFKNVKGIKITARGYANGEFCISTSLNGPILAKLKMEYSTIWEEYAAECNIPDGVSAIYITYIGDGDASIKSFEFLH